MTTNSAIQTELSSQLVAANLGYSISWPGIDFKPPDSGTWLVVTFLPNRGVDDRLANDGYVSPRGIFQVSVESRPQSEIKLQETAEEVKAALPKGTEIAGNIRVGSHPYSGTAQIEGDRMRVVVSVEYSE